MQTDTPNTNTLKSTKYKSLPGISTMWSSFNESGGTCDLEFLTFNEDEKEGYEAFIAVRGIINADLSNVNKTLVGYMVDTIIQADRKKDSYYLLYNIFDVVELVNELKQNMIAALGPETRITNRPI